MEGQPNRIVMYVLVSLRGVSIWAELCMRAGELLKTPIGHRSRFHDSKGYRDVTGHPALCPYKEHVSKKWLISHNQYLIYSRKSVFLSVVVVVQFEYAYLKNQVR